MVEVDGKAVLDSAAAVHPKSPCRCGWTVFTRRSSKYRQMDSNMRGPENWLKAWWHLRDGTNKPFGKRSFWMGVDSGTRTRRHCAETDNHHFLARCSEAPCDWEIEARGPLGFLSWLLGLVR